MKQIKFVVLATLVGSTLFMTACGGTPKVDDNLIMDTDFNSSFDDVAIADEDSSFDGGLVDAEFTSEEIDDIQYDPNAIAQPGIDISSEAQTYNTSAFISSSMGYPEGRHRTSTSSSYTVQKGDSLWKISRKYGTSVSALANANNISESAIIRIGQRLRIPGKSSSSYSSSSARGGKSYTVQAGDSYYKIAKKYGISTNALMANNNTSSPNLKVGQVIQIP